MFFLLPKTVYPCFETNDNLNRAHAFILNLQYEEAGKYLEREKANGLSLLYHSYLDFISAFVTEDEEKFELFKKNSEARLAAVTKLCGEKVTPWHDYILSEIYLQQSLLHAKFDEYVAAAFDMHKAYRLINRNKKNHPSFFPNHKISGLLNTIIGSVTPNYEWILRLAGIQGNFGEGVNELLHYHANASVEAQCHEALFYLGNIYSFNSAAVDSGLILSGLKSAARSSQLLTYVYVNILMKMGQNDAVIEAIGNSFAQQPQSPIAILHYKRGLARLRKLDLSAEIDFNEFLGKFSGRNNVKSAHQKLAWIALLKGNPNNYAREMTLCVKSGSRALEEDADAHNEAESGIVPNAALLRARLLFDGGYYAESLNEISRMKQEDFPRQRDRLEFNYRMGRIMQMTHRPDNALNYFTRAFELGKNSDSHLSANSCLMMALIYEERKQFALAESHFRKCLAMDYKIYKPGIDSKANAGLARIRDAGSGKD